MASSSGILVQLSIDRNPIITLLLNQDSDEFQQQVLAKQWGCAIIRIDEHVVLKQGAKVRPSEEIAMRLVKEHAPSVPIPDPYHFGFRVAQEHPIGQIFMSFIPGTTLDTLWDSLHDSAKKRICGTIWEYIAAIRLIPQPACLMNSYCCAADGSSVFDPLLGDNRDPMPPINDDDALRERIFDRYKRHNGLSYADGKDLPKLLPRSTKSVFSHGDIAPRNIMVDENGVILSIIDWEAAGWYPDYWEYASMMKYARDRDWKDWMDHTKPSSWDIGGIKKARRVLF